MRRWSEDLVQRSADVHQLESGIEQRVTFLRQWEADLHRRQQQILRRQTRVETAFIAVQRREMQLVDLERGAHEAKKKAHLRFENGFRLAEQVHRQRLLLEASRQAQQMADVAADLRRKETREVGTMTAVPDEDFVDVLRTVELSRRSQLLDGRERKLQAVQRINDALERRRRKEFSALCGEMVQNAAGVLTVSRALKGMAQSARMLLLTQAHPLTTNVTSPSSSESAADGCAGIVPLFDLVMLDDAEAAAESIANSALLCSSQLMTTLAEATATPEESSAAAEGNGGLRSPRGANSHSGGGGQYGRSVTPPWWAPPSSWVGHDASLTPTPTAARMGRHDSPRGTPARAVTPPASGRREVVDVSRDADDDDLPFEML